MNRTITESESLQDLSQPTMPTAQACHVNSSASQQRDTDRAAREQVLTQVSPAINLAAAGVSFSSQGRLLVIGPEHRIQLAAARLQKQVPLTGLITEAMPAQVDAEMEAAADLTDPIKPYRLPLATLGGYLGQFEVLVEIDNQDQPQNLATLAHGVERFDLVLDLGQQPQLTMALKPAGYFAAADAEQLERALVDIPTLKGGFEKPQYFKIYSDLCALSGSGMTGCTRCLDVCPADAISVVNATVQIDAHLCHGAGGCASACPTSAIRYGFPQPGLLLDTLQRLLNGYRNAGGKTPHVLLHDAASVEPGNPNLANPNALAELLTQLPGHYLPLQIEEMGSAGIEVWLSAIALGASGVSLLVDGLPSSEQQRLPESIRLVLDSEIETANRLLTGLQLPTRIALVDPSQLIAASQVTVQTPIEPIAQLDTQADKRQQISQAMRHLYQQQSAANELSTELPVEVALDSGASFGRVDVDSTDCTLCMSCVSICPTKALSSSPDTPRLSFNEDACVQCNLCTQACPESVLTLSPRYLLDPEQRTTTRVLHEEKPFCCISCGDPFATQSVITLMLKKLAGHSMFDNDGLRRLEMCADCRVIDIVKTDPGDDLFSFAKGRPAEAGEINLAQPADDPQVKNETPDTLSVNNAEVLS
ncbi:MAG: 4Fe-4S binding protein [Motiliproteus sp.]